MDRIENHLMDSVLFTSDIVKPLSRVERVLQLLELSRQMQKDKRELGVDRVHKYYSDVEGDWLDNW